MGSGRRGSSFACARSVKNAETIAATSLWPILWAKVVEPRECDQLRLRQNGKELRQRLVGTGRGRSLVPGQQEDLGRDAAVAVVWEEPALLFTLLSAHRQQQDQLQQRAWYRAGCPRVETTPYRAPTDLSRSVFWAPGDREGSCGS